ncbi:uncharacterized protein BKCO1_800024 [Diplodia corticola]|uniref:Uncharacterized protein n=1 Tax=Diplodia corticola TaxID=236234 RepID=A0A1J9RX37_9PEZI|nr:uncharacterized protein BKCO1_800024 [Diplodia corticola]OJD37203.1 hypothetical protein BKCO1_800024 [Diplodia corticola]
MSSTASTNQKSQPWQKYVQVGPDAAQSWDSSKNVTGRSEHGGGLDGGNSVPKAQEKSNVRLVAEKDAHCLDPDSDDE